MALPFADAALPGLAELRSSQASVHAAITRAVVDADSLYQPAASWTRRQLAWHIADTETAICLRLCHILAEERPALRGIPEDLWAAALPRTRDPRVAADWFRASRATVLDLLPGVAEGLRGRIGIHSSLGAMTFDDTLRHLHHHALHHAQQLDAWNAAEPRSA